MTFCSKCQALNPNDAKACLSCGAPLACPTCGTLAVNSVSSMPLLERLWVDPRSFRLDKASLLLGILILATAAVPWVIGGAVRESFKTTTFYQDSRAILSLVLGDSRSMTTR